MGIHRRRRATRHTAAMTLCPPGSGGVGPSATLPLLADVPHRLVAAPRIRPHGVPNAAVATPRTGSWAARDAGMRARVAAGFDSGLYLSNDRLPSRGPRSRKENLLGQVAGHRRVACQGEDNQ